MKRLFAVLCAYAAFSGNALAYGEHLEPEGSIFTELRWHFFHLKDEDSESKPRALVEADWLYKYHAMVLSVLVDAYAQNVKTRAIILPTFSPEYAVGITEDKDAYGIFYLQPEVSLSAYVGLDVLKESAKTHTGEALKRIEKMITELDAVLPENPMDVGIERYACAIESSLAERIIQVWDTMLQKTHYAKDHPNGTDGATYHFSMFSLNYFLELAGTTWSPPEDSNTGRLVAITDSMRDLCLSGEKKLLSQLDQQVNALSTRLRD